MFINIMKRLATIITFALAVLAFPNSASAQKYNDIFQMIRGRVPGVQVGDAGPGGMPRIIIRGIGTNSEQTQPMFIVDGLQVDNISAIDPDNVDSIEVIKDGSSAIYGMQGQNGVIMITTKGAVMAAKAEAEARKAERKAKRNKAMIDAIQATRDRNEAQFKADSIARAQAQQQ